MEQRVLTVEGEKKQLNNNFIGRPEAYLKCGKLPSSKGWGLGGAGAAPRIFQMFLFGIEADQ